MFGNTKKKYIESHWLVFALKGLFALLFGYFIMFTNIRTFFALVMVVGWTLIALGLVEAFNILYRKPRHHNWGLSLAIALIELGIGIGLVVAADAEAWIVLVVVGAYTIIRGFFDITLGIKGLTDKTDKFMWIICGMFGAILGFAILGDAGESNMNFLRIFGTYMMIFGVTNLIFAIHSKNLLAEAAASAKRLTSIKKSKKDKTKTPAKPAKKSQKTARSVSKDGLQTRSVKNKKKL
jgi:uncharacterized membrane protein HdeD (DUF308 family)